RYRPRGGVEVAQNAAPLRRREKIERPDRLPGIGERRQQPHESLLQLGKLVRAVQQWVAVEINPQLAVIAAVIENDGQVIDRTIREVVGGGSVASETQVVVKRHEVDRWTEHSLVSTAPDIAPQIRDVVTLVSKHLAHPPCGLADEFGYRHAWTHRQSYGQD